MANNGKTIQLQVSGWPNILETDPFLTSVTGTDLMWRISPASRLTSCLLPGRGLANMELRLPSLGFDVDEPEDLARLTRATADRAAYQFLASTFEAAE